MCPKKDGTNVEVRIYVAGRQVKGRAHFCRAKSRAEAEDVLSKVLWGIAAGLFKHAGPGEVFNLSIDAGGMVFEAGPDPFNAALPGGQSLIDNLTTFRWKTVRHVEEDA